MKTMGEALDCGLVLVISMWDDIAVSMNWLESCTGAFRSPCDLADGKPESIHDQHVGRHRGVHELAGSSRMMAARKLSGVRKLALVVKPQTPLLELPALGADTTVGGKAGISLGADALGIKSVSQNRAGRSLAAKPRS